VTFRINHARDFEEAGRSRATVTIVGNEKEVERTVENILAAIAKEPGASRLAELIEGGGR